MWINFAAIVNWKRKKKRTRDESYNVAGKLRSIVEEVKVANWCDAHTHTDSVGTFIHNLLFAHTTNQSTDKRWSEREQIAARKKKRRRTRKKKIEKKFRDAIKLVGIRTMWDTAHALSRMHTPWYYVLESSRGQLCVLGERYALRASNWCVCMR